MLKTKIIKKTFVFVAKSAHTPVVRQQSRGVNPLTTPHSRQREPYASFREKHKTQHTKNTNKQNKHKHK